MSKQQGVIDMRNEHGEEADMKTSEQNNPSVESRRNFLKTMAATGGAAAVTMGLAGHAVAGERQEFEPDSPREKLGYQETPHIKDYYAKAGF